MNAKPRTLHHYPALKRPFVVKPDMARFKDMAAANAYIAQRNRIEAAQADARRIVQYGKCPECGRPLRRNSWIEGWWQCSQLGSETFRADPAAPPCHFQCFTE